MQHLQTVVETDIGRLYLVASELGLCQVDFEKQAVPMIDEASQADADWGSTRQFLEQAAREITEYFMGERTEFEVPLVVQGTPFQLRVWDELKRIPYGSTLSYSDIAARVENPKAVRAVGSANGRNPLCIIVPCHRVIAADGTLGGYAAGLKIKSQLLQLEQARRA